MENYEVVRTIGKGSYGKVCLAIHRATGRQVSEVAVPAYLRNCIACCSIEKRRVTIFCASPQVALKVIKMSELKTEQRVRERVHREIALMERLRGHDNIVQYIESELATWRTQLTRLHTAVYNII